MINLLKYLYAALFTAVHDTYPVKIYKESKSKKAKVKQLEKLLRP